MNEGWKEGRKGRGKIDNQNWNKERNNIRKSEKKKKERNSSTSSTDGSAAL